jgi:hypothetical protein
LPDEPLYIPEYDTIEIKLLSVQHLYERWLLSGIVVLQPERDARRPTYVDVDAGEAAEYG